MTDQDETLLAPAAEHRGTARGEEKFSRIKANPIDEIPIYPPDLEDELEVSSKVRREKAGPVQQVAKDDDATMLYPGQATVSQAYPDVQSVNVVEGSSGSNTLSDEKQPGDHILAPGDDEATLFNPESQAILSTAAEEKTELLAETVGNAETQSQSVAAQSALSGFSLGGVIKNRFEILESLGEGGMGMVFKAVDRRKLEARSRNPYVAIKVLNPALAKNEVLVAALQRECEKAQALSHPNIITVYDFDRDGDHVFMSMEYLSGKPLTAIIREAAGAGGMKLERAWPIIRKMGEALAYAHKKQIVHSDFKPANVFVTDDDEVKVLDFGIASRLDHGENNELTVFDARLEGGLTPPYASLEMMNGGKADPRDDIYAFGLVVFELLTGRHPYQRRPASKVFFDRQRDGHGPDLKPISGLSRKQWRLLKSALALLQAQRPRSLEEWLVEFAPKSGNTGLKIVIGFLVIVILFAAGWFYRQSAQKPSEALVEHPARIVKPPVADVGLKKRQAKVGESVGLDGRASSAENGGPVAFQWRLLARPDGSNSELQSPSSASPEFIPDKAGVYAVELTVSDSLGSTSTPTLVTIDAVNSSASGQLLQQASSADGVLYLAAGKSQYRIGEELSLTIRLAKPGYLRVSYLGASGEISDLMPNQFQSGKVKADVEYRIPPKGDTFKLQVTGPVGVDRVIAVFSSKPLPKLDAVVNADGSIVNQLLNSDISSVVIGYDVLKKAG